jgi:hypothetical protein
LCLKDGQWICLYPGDGGFEDSNPDIAEPLHRSLINLAGMQYTHSGQDVGVIAMDSP